MFDDQTKNQKKLPPADESAQIMYTKYWRQMLLYPEESPAFDEGWQGTLELEQQYHFDTTLLRVLRSKARAI